METDKQAPSRPLPRRLQAPRRRAPLRASRRISLRSLNGRAGPAAQLG